jgi:hypothetical protein
MDDRRASEVVNSWQRRGFPPDDGQRIVRTALRWLGAPYGITTVTGGALLDCSSLVSQSHWEAAGILVPFTVSGQHRSMWAEDVPSTASAAIGDVLICNDADRHHAGLVAGWDGEEHIVLESVPGEGCRLSRHSGRSLSFADLFAIGTRASPGQHGLLWPVLSPRWIGMERASIS